MCYTSSRERRIYGTIKVGLRCASVRENASPPFLESDSPRGRGQPAAGENAFGVYVPNPPQGNSNYKRSEFTNEGCRPLDRSALNDLDEGRTKVADGSIKIASGKALIISG